MLECVAFERSVRTTPSEPRNWAAPPQARSPISRTAAAGASMHADSTHAQGRTHPLSCIGDAALLPISAAQYGALPACRWLIHRAPTSSPSARSGSGLRSRLENCSLLSEASRVGRLRFTVWWPPPPLIPERRQRQHFCVSAHATSGVGPRPCGLPEGIGAPAAAVRRVGEPRSGGAAQLRGCEGVVLAGRTLKRSLAAPLLNLGVVLELF